MKRASKKRVFLTGANGSMGQAAAAELVAAGHDVLGTARSREGAALLKTIGAGAIEVDPTDESALRNALVGFDVVVHFATSIPRGLAAVNLSSWEANDRLRREGTAALMAAGHANGVKRFIFESIALAYPDRRDEWIDESVPLTAVSPVMRTAIEAEALLETFPGGAVSLRYGRLYGPGRASEDLIAAFRTRQMPIVGTGTNYVSSIHVADVGTSVVAALDVPPGAYNVVDDTPVRQREYAETIAAQLGAPRPRRVPRLLARVVMGHIESVLTVSQRVSNRRFKDASGWTPRYPSLADGWRARAPIAS